MTAHGVLVRSAVMAKDVDSLNRFALSADALDNGNVVRLDTLSATAGYGEVWSATKPLSAGTLLGGLWMVAEPEVVIITAADGTEYKGINADPRNFFTAAGKVFTAFKLQVGDKVKLTGDALTGTKSTNTFVNAADSTYVLTWGASATANALSLKLVGTDPDYISIGSGTLGSTQRVAAYNFVCVQN